MNERKEKVEDCNLDNEVLNLDVGLIVDVIIGKALYEITHESVDGVRLKGRGASIWCHGLLLARQSRDFCLALKKNWHSCGGNDTWSGGKCNRGTTYTNNNSRSKGRGKSLRGRASGHLSLRGLNGGFLSFALL